MFQKLSWDRFVGGVQTTYLETKSSITLIRFISNNITTLSVFPVRDFNPTPTTFTSQITFEIKQIFTSEMSMTDIRKIFGPSTFWCLVHIERFDFMIFIPTSYGAYSIFSIPWGKYVKSSDFFLS